MREERRKERGDKERERRGEKERDRKGQIDEKLMGLSKTKIESRMDKEKERNSMN
jgi:hypothetical protein